MGYDLVLWLDASVVVRKSLDPIWKMIKETGTFFAQNFGYTLDEWAGDSQLLAMNCPIAMAPWVPVCQSGMVGLSAFDPRCQLIVQEMVSLAYRWHGLAYNGSDDGSSPAFKGVRHDQNIFSWLAHKYMMDMYQGVACYTGKIGIDDAVVEFKCMGDLRCIAREMKSK